MLWIARTGAPWPDPPERFGKYDSIYQRFNCWSKQGRWQAIFEALQEPDLESMMIDSSCVRAHQHAAGQKSIPDEEALGRSRGGFTTKLHAAGDALGNPLDFVLTPGQRSDITQAEALGRGLLRRRGGHRRQGLRQRCFHCVRRSAGGRGSDTVSS